MSQPDLTSGPVDPQNPTFDSLLGALKAAHEGELDSDGLRAYHDGLRKMVRESRAAIEALDVPEEFVEARNQTRTSLGGLDILELTLDQVQRYLEEPGDQQMAACVNSLLYSVGMMEELHERLAANIKT